MYVLRYNLEHNDDDPLSEAVVEEIRHADTMDIIRFGIIFTSAGSNH